MQGRKLAVFVLSVGSLMAVAPAAGAATPDGSVTVCNEAENSHRGGYVVTDGPVDSVPPAFLRGSQMRVGANDNAALHAPALRVCATPPPPPPPPPPPWDGGGGEDPQIN
jgi:hypothetical protein